MKCRTLIARFTGPTWGPPGADRTQVGPMSAPWSLLSEVWCTARRVCIIGDTFLSGCGLVLPCLASSCVVWVYGKLQHIYFFNKYEYPFHNLHTYHSPLCKAITTSFSDCKKNVQEWFLLAHTRQSKTRQDKARQDKKGVPWFSRTPYISHTILIYIQLFKTPCFPSCWKKTYRIMKVI